MSSSPTTTTSNSRDLYFHTPNPGVLISRSSHLLSSKSIILRGSVSSHPTKISPGVVIRGDLCMTPSTSGTTAAPTQGSNIIIGRGVTIGPETVIRPPHLFSLINPENYPNPFACSDPGEIVLTPDTLVIGEGTTIGKGVTLDGVKNIGLNVRIGDGAVLCNNVVVHDNVTVCCDSVIREEVVLPPNSTWRGCPAQRVEL